MNTQAINYGPMNGHSIGMVMKDIMRRTMEEIWKRRIGFVASEKIVDYKADPRDRVTDADFASQEIFVRKLTECFAGYGIVAEEENFHRECTLGGTKLFFTVDPLDGTKAFERRQSQGFGPMLSLCTKDAVIASFVGDAMTKELYYYRPDSESVHRLNFGDHQYERLGTYSDRPLSERYVLLRDDPLGLPDVYRKLARPVEHGGLFKNIEVMGGGIGTGMARLWKGEVSACIIKAGIEQPWDILPVWGISEKLGFVYLILDQTGHWTKRTMKPSMTAVRFCEPSVIIHASRVDEFVAAALNVR